MSKVTYDELGKITDKMFGTVISKLAKEVWGEEISFAKIPTKEDVDRLHSIMTLLGHKGYKFELLNEGKPLSRLSLMFGDIFELNRDKLYLQVKYGNGNIRLYNTDGSVIES